MKGLKRYKSGGIEYIYHRASGIQLPAENDPNFARAYSEAESGLDKSNKRNGPDTLEAAINALYHSDLWKVGLKHPTQIIYKRDFKRLISKAGHVKLRHINKNHIERDMASLKPNPANLRRRVWRKLMEFAMQEGLVEADPTIAIKGRMTPKTSGHTTWTVQDVADFREYWPIDSAPRIAMELFQWSGARVVDVMALGPAQIRDGYLYFTQEKTGYDCTLPLVILPIGMAALQSDLTHFQMAVRHAKDHLVWVTTSHGKPRSQKGLSQWFSAMASQAGLGKDRTAHGLRKYRDVRLAEAGLSTLQIRSWTGQQDLKTLEIYIKDANLRAVLEGPKPERNLSKRSKH